MQEDEKDAKTTRPIHSGSGGDTDNAVADTRRNPTGRIGYRLEAEAQAARDLVNTIRETLTDDDDELIHDMIEGETSLLEVIHDAIDRIAMLESFDASLKARMEEMSGRRKRFAAQVDLIRAAVHHAMSLTGEKRFEFADATVSLRKTPATLIVDEPADIPSQFWEPQPPKLDRRKLLDYLKNNNGICAGASMSAPGETVSIRRG